MTFADHLIDNTAKHRFPGLGLEALPKKHHAFVGFCGFAEKQTGSLRTLLR
jgi:hypothetical protein